MSLECVVNVSEGRDDRVVDRLAAACGHVLLDVHSDPDHDRSVLTLAGDDELVESSVRMLAAAVVSAVDFSTYAGQHPAFGVLDVVPFVPLVRVPSDSRVPAGGEAAAHPAAPARLATVPRLDRALAARDRFARWAGSELGIPCYLYGPLPPGGHRTLPQLRRNAGEDLEPDTGPARPQPRTGSCAVGARHFLVAYNVWLAGADVDVARSVASAIRGPAVRAIGLDLAGRAQVSCNLVDPLTIGPAEVFDEIAARVELAGAGVDHCELVGLVPASVLAGTPEHRWTELDLHPETTIEARMEDLGLSWG